MQIKDSPDSYGWLSIWLHWLAALAIIVLWLVGNTFSGAEAEMRVQLQQFHVALGGAALIFLLFRVGWRLVLRHPYLRGQSSFFHRIGVGAHYLILICVTAMLISGPMMIWSQGLSIQVFDWFSIPGPVAADETLFRSFRTMHITTASILVWLILLHIAGAFKHYVFNDDETLVRIFWPPKNRAAPETEKRSPDV